MKRIAGFESEAVSLYNIELMNAYKQLGFEILICCLLLVAIALINHNFLFFIEAIMAIKAYFSWDHLDLIKKGKVTFFRVDVTFCMHPIFCVEKHGTANNRVIKRLIVFRGATNRLRHINIAYADCAGLHRYSDLDHDATVIFHVFI